jgi:Tol biopolymer transport system component
MDMVTGEVRLLPGADLPVGGLPQVLSDGRTLAYRRTETSEIVFRDLETGLDRVVASSGTFNAAFRVSPDRRFVATLNTRMPDSAKADIQLVDIETGRSRTLVEYQNPLSRSRCQEPATFECDVQPQWSADGRYVYYYDRTASSFVAGTSVRQAELWRIAVAGGPPERLGLALDNFQALALSPDGRHLAFMRPIERRGMLTLDGLVPPLPSTTARRSRP